MVGITRPTGTPYQFRQEEITIEERFASKERYRATSHDHPTPLPCTRKTRHRVLTEILEDEVLPRLPRIMARHAIDYIASEVEVAQYFQAHEDPTGRFTVTIPTTGEGCEAWREAAREVRDLFCELAAGEWVVDLQVEIQNKEKMYCDISWAVWDDDVISAMSKVRDDIVKAVSSTLEDSWTSIGYHLRVDHRKTPSINDGDAGKNTIVVFCRPESRGNFVRAESAILEILKDVPFDIHVEFLPGEIVATATDEAPGAPDVLESPVPESPENGASIGVSGGAHQVGTLGGWFMLEVEGRRIPCALTAYSAVRSANKTVARITDAVGVRPSAPYGHAAVEYPAAYDVEYSIDVLENALEPDELDASPEHAALLRRHDSPNIGEVLLASGLRRIVTGPEDRGVRLDWALIHSPDTFKYNTVVPSRELATSSQLVQLSLMDSMNYSAPRGAQMRGFSDLRRQVVMAKCGRTTGNTWGYANPLPRDINRGSYHTSEWEIMSPVHHFAAYGDAGALVHNADHEIVGMLAAADRNPCGFNSGFLTHFRQIAEDVERLTGGTLTLKPGALPVANRADQRPRCELTKSAGSRQVDGLETKLRLLSLSR